MASLRALIQGRRLAVIRLQKQSHSRDRVQMCPHKLGGAICGTVVHHQDFELRIVGIQRRANRIQDHGFFVIRGDQDADLG